MGQECEQKKKKEKKAMVMLRSIRIPICIRHAFDKIDNIGR